MDPVRIAEGLRRANRLVAVALGLLLALTALFVIADVALRAAGRSLGGSDEISGYVMAIVTSWGLGFALGELAHVRIDLVRRRVASAARAALDLLALGATAAVAAVVAWRAWAVLGKSLARGSRANTPLETPLWIPQGLWWAGLLWFAIVAILCLVLAIALLARGERAAMERVAGTEPLPGETPSHDAPRSDASPSGVLPGGTAPEDGVAGAERTR